MTVTADSGALRDRQRFFRQIGSTRRGITVSSPLLSPHELFTDVAPKSKIPRQSFFEL